MYIFCIYTYLWKKLKPSINVHVCMHAYMYVWMYGKSQMNRVLNEICTQLGMLRCKIFVAVLLGEPNTWNLCFLNMNSRKHQKNTRHTHVCIHFFVCIHIFGKKLKPSINVHVCMHAYMYVWMYGKITNKQSFE